MTYFDVHPDGAWSVPPGTDVLGIYRSETACSDAIIADADLDHIPPNWPDVLGPPQTVAQILVRVIGETAAHAGHLDVIRESIDGTQWLVLD